MQHMHGRQIFHRRLSEFEVVWGDVSEGFGNPTLEKEILNELKPSNGHLKQLIIRSYGGLDFPSWVGDPSFLQLKHVSIRGCKKCTSLPPVGQIHTLKELFVEGLEGVKFVGSELLGTGRAFPSLEVLSFENMPGWEEWSTNHGVVFPSLQQLHIKDCPNLVEVLLQTLPSLNILEINKCDSGVLRKLVQVASSATRLEVKSISGLNYMVWRGVVEYLGAVEELTICKCNELRYLWESKAEASKVLVNLKNLKVLNCNNLVSFGEKEEDAGRSNLLKSLRLLSVSDCNNMKHCSCPDSIETLLIIDCISITTLSFPTGGCKLKSLVISDCGKLLERELGGQKIKNRSNMKMLESVWINGWPNLKSFIELNSLVHLMRLGI